MTGHVDIYTKRAAQGIAECEHALALDRNLATAHAFIGLGKIFVGRAEETEAHIAEAARLSPRDNMGFRLDEFCGRREARPRQLRAGGRMVSTVERGQPKLSVTYFQSAGRPRAPWSTDEAHSAVKTGLALNPAFAISRVRAAWTARSDNPKYLAQLEPIFDGMRKAEVPNDRTRSPAILAAKVVGFSRPLGEDKVGTEHTTKPASRMGSGRSPSNSSPLQERIGSEVVSHLVVKNHFVKKAEPQVRSSIAPQTMIVRKWWWEGTFLGRVFGFSQHSARRG